MTQLSDAGAHSRPLTAALVAVPVGRHAYVLAAVRTLPEFRAVGVVFGPVRDGVPEIRAATAEDRVPLLAFSVEDLGLRDGSWRVLAADEREARTIEAECARSLDRLAALAPEDFHPVDERSILRAAAPLYDGSTLPLCAVDVTTFERALGAYFGRSDRSGAEESAAEIAIQRRLAARLRAGAEQDVVFLHRAELREEALAHAVAERLERLGFSAGVHAQPRGASVYAVDSAPLSYPALRAGRARVGALVEEFGGRYTSWEAVSERGTIYASAEAQPTDLSLDVTRGSYSA